MSIPRISPFWRNLVKTAPDTGCIPSRRSTPATIRALITFGRVLGAILKHADENTYVVIISDHGIKPLREFEEKDPHAHMDHEKTTPVIAKHDFADGDDVPGSLFVMGPGIKHD